MGVNVCEKYVAVTVRDDVDEGKEEYLHVCVSLFLPKKALFSG